MSQVTALALARSLVAPAGVGIAVVLPFVSLEWANTRGFQQGMPVPLFALMWLLVALFTAVALPTVRRLSTGPASVSFDAGQVARVAFLMLVAWAWVMLVSDQMPCFLGVPNCD